LFGKKFFAGGFEKMRKEIDAAHTEVAEIAEGMKDFYRRELRQAASRRREWRSAIALFFMIFMSFMVKFRRSSTVKGMKIMKVRKSSLRLGVSAVPLTPETEVPVLFHAEVAKDAEGMSGTHCGSHGGTKITEE
jgi:hypothetical protein